MNGLKLKICVALVALALPAAAPAQFCKSCTVQQVDIPILDGAGNVRAIMRYYAGEPGKRQISFLDPNYMVVNTITESPAPAAVAENALRGDPLPDLPVISEDKTDANSAIKHLQDEVDALYAQVRLLTARINAAAAR
jgi:hypothetical protein